MSDASSPDTPTDAIAPVSGAEDTAVSTESTSEKLEKGNRRFTSWRKKRAFAAGLLMIISGAWILTPAYLSLSVSNIQIQISTLGGVSTLVIGILLIVCGLMTWFRGEGRILTGVAAMILGIVALPQSNFGGFVIGTLLAVIGGALALAWVPQSKEDARAEKQEKKAAKAEKKAGKNSGSAASTTAAVAVLAALAVGVGAHAPRAAAQLPELPELQLPTIPGLTQDENDEDADGTSSLPTLPEVEVPSLGLPDGNVLQDQIDTGLEELGVEIPGLNVAPPAPLTDGLPVTGSTFTIKADRTSMTPNMKLSVVTIDTLQGPKKAFRIDSDQTIITNLRVQFPNGVPGAQDLGQDTLNEVTTLTGNFHIFIKKMTITAELMGVDTMLPITLDADWAPDQLVEELSKMGIGLPDFLSGKTDILNATMETYLVRADVLEAPTNEIGPWAA
ncbi:DUF6114 domain-containing protein [Corynebacterium terpenotabidum]|uniref:Uncharacterized protein n=1 Tax=Corynebacterium terpenotabidum Y-11 TaxID=1200352 RepID=S4X9S3_9CORY|nr:DUF6114 domain-containing protein [Corynebacterium terpenotabidum]AGP29867.1 hypothetical protein A606_01060 [Corynebacterium terpenotabidum Y-11]